MIPTISTPVPTQMPPPVQTAAVAGVPTETSFSARLPIYAVPSSVSAMEVYNNGRGGKPAASTAAPRGTPLLSTPSYFNVTAPELEEAPVRISPFTSAFMAQVMGQKPNGSNSEALVSLFFGNPETIAQLASRSVKPIVAARISPSGLPAPSDPTAVLRTAPSLVRRTGIAGYQASFVRNDAQLAIRPAPESKVA